MKDRHLRRALEELGITKDFGYDVLDSGVTTRKIHRADFRASRALELVEALMEHLGLEAEEAQSKYKITKKK